MWGSWSATWSNNAFAGWSPTWSNPVTTVPGYVTPGHASGTGVTYSGTTTVLTADAGAAVGTGSAFTALYAWGAWYATWSNPVSTAGSVAAGHASGTGETYSGASSDRTTDAGIATGTGTTYNISDPPPPPPPPSEATAEASVTVETIVRRRPGGRWLDSPRTSPELTEVH